MRTSSDEWPLKTGYYNTLFSSVSTSVLLIVYLRGIFFSRDVIVLGMINISISSWQFLSRSILLFFGTACALSSISVVLPRFLFDFKAGDCYVIVIHFLGMLVRRPVDLVF